MPVYSGTSENTPLQLRGAYQVEINKQVDPSFGGEPSDIALEFGTVLTLNGGVGWSILGDPTTQAADGIYIGPDVRGDQLHIDNGNAMFCTIIVKGIRGCVLDKAKLVLADGVDWSDEVLASGKSVEKWIREELDITLKDTVNLDLIPNDELPSLPVEEEEPGL